MHARHNHEHSKFPATYLSLLHFAKVMRCESCEKVAKSIGSFSARLRLATLAKACRARIEALHFAKEVLKRQGETRFEHFSQAKGRILRAKCQQSHRIRPLYLALNSVIAPCTEFSDCNALKSKKKSQLKFKSAHC